MGKIGNTCEKRFKFIKKCHKKGQIRVKNTKTCGKKSDKKTKTNEKVRKSDKPV